MMGDPCLRQPPMGGTLKESEPEMPSKGGGYTLPERTYSHRGKYAKRCMVPRTGAHFDPSSIRGRKKRASLRPGSTGPLGRAEHDPVGNFFSDIAARFFEAFGGRDRRCLEPAAVRARCAEDDHHVARKLVH